MEPKERKLMPFDIALEKYIVIINKSLVTEQNLNHEARSISNLVVIDSGSKLMCGSMPQELRDKKLFHRIVWLLFLYRILKMPVS